MLNLALPTQIRPLSDTPTAATKPDTLNNRADEATDVQFSNVLAREVSEKTNTHGTDDRIEPSKNHDNKESSPIPEPSSEKTIQSQPLDNISSLNSNASLNSSALLNNSVIPNNAATLGSITRQRPHTENSATSGKKLLFSDKTNHSTLSNQGKQIQNTSGNNTRLLLEPADFSDSGKNLPFSSETGTNILSSTDEPTIASLPDSNRQPGLNSVTSIASTLTSPTAATNSTHTISLDIPVGQPKWDGEFTQKIVWLTTQQNQVAEIRLNPAHLGPVEIMLSVTNDQGTQAATAQFVSSHLAVREAIEAALPKLREMMAENGIELGNVTVGADSFQQQANTEQRENSPSKSSTNLISTKDESTNQIEARIVSNRHQGLVNTFA